MDNKLAQLREKVSVFLYGRNGIDQLNIALLLLFVFFCIIHSFTYASIFSTILWLCAALMLVLFIFRMLSRDIPHRGEENRKFLVLLQNITEFLKLQFRRVKEIKTHRFRRCPSCKKTLRLPNIKGTHTAHCPCCGEDFKVNIKF